MTKSDSTHLPAARLAIAVVALCVGVAAWPPALNSAMGAVGHTRVVGGLLVLFAAFLPLGLLGRRRPFAPMRAALAIAVVLTVLLMMSLPVPPRPESVGSFVVLFLVLVLALATHLLAPSRPRMAFLALALLAVVGVYLGYAVDLYTTSPRFGASVKGSSWPVAIIGMACIAACWHGRRLRGGAYASHLGAAL